MKAKLIISAEIEYEIDPSSYPSGMSLVDMLALDVKNTTADPYFMLDGHNVKWSVTGELVEEAKP